MKGIVHTVVTRNCCVHASFFLPRTYHAHARAVRASKSMHTSNVLNLQSATAMHCMQVLTVPLLPQPKGRNRNRKRNGGTVSPSL